MGYSAFPKSGAVANDLTCIAMFALSALKPPAKVGQWILGRHLIHCYIPAIHQCQLPA